MTSKRKLAVSLALGLLAFGATRAILAGRWYRIPQNGMYPGLPAGSYLVVNRNAYRGPDDVQRGDIVVFVRNEKGARYTYIWRVVGLPGDSIVVRGHHLAVNGTPLPQVETRHDAARTVFREQNGPRSYEVAYPSAGQPAIEPPPVDTRVPPSTFFVMGDNRYNAIDSRHFGPVPFEDILGKHVWSPGS